MNSYSATFLAFHHARMRFNEGLGSLDELQEAYNRLELVQRANGETFVSNRSEPGEPSEKQIRARLDASGYTPELYLTGDGCVSVRAWDSGTGQLMHVGCGASERSAWRDLNRCMTRTLVRRG